MRPDPPTSISRVTIALSVTLLRGLWPTLTPVSQTKAAFCQGPSCTCTPPPPGAQAPGSSTCYAIAASLASETRCHKSMTTFVIHP